MVGIIRSDETRKKMSIARTGISRSDEIRKKISQTMGTTIYL